MASAAGWRIIPVRFFGFGAPRFGGRTRDTDGASAAAAIGALSAIFGGDCLFVCHYCDDLEQFAICHTRAGGYPSSSQTWIPLLWE